jgi:CheY-like chemotaxis protein
MGKAFVPVLCPMAPASALVNTYAYIFAYTHLPMSLSLPATASGILLILVACSLGLIFFLALLLHRQRRENAALKQEVTLLRRTAEQAPRDNLHLDAGETIQAANQTINQAAQNSSASKVGNKQIQEIQESDEELHTSPAPAAAPSANHMANHIAPSASSNGQNEFLNKLSHDVRTPLNAITGYAEILANSELEDQQQRFATNIYKSSLALVAVLDACIEQVKGPVAQQALAAHKKGLPQDPAVYAETSAEGVQGLKILVVDDSSMIRTLFTDIFNDVFTDMFSDAPLTIHTAGNGAEALELAGSQQPDLMFVDLHLPDMDGWQIAKALRKNEQTAAIPLMVMTGQNLSEKEYRPLFNGFLQKPFQLELLRNMLHSWLPEQMSTTANSPPETVPTPLHKHDQDSGLALRLQPHWPKGLDSLLTRAIQSGALSVAEELGKRMQEAGEQHSAKLLQETGSRLARQAAEPDITSVEALLAGLASLLPSEPQP